MIHAVGPCTFWRVFRIFYDSGLGAKLPLKLVFLDFAFVSTDPYYVSVFTSTLENTFSPYYIWHGNWYVLLDLGNTVVLFRSRRILLIRRIFILTPCFRAGAI